MMSVTQNVMISYVLFFVRVRFINGKVPGCRWVMRAVMNAVVVELPVLSKISNGNIQKVGTGLSSG